VIFRPTITALPHLRSGKLPRARPGGRERSPVAAGTWDHRRAACRLRGGQLDRHSSAGRHARGLVATLQQERWRGGRSKNTTELRKQETVATRRRMAMRNGQARFGALHGAGNGEMERGVW